MKEYVTLDAEQPLLDADQQIVTSQQPFDYMSFFRDSFKDDLYRSQTIRNQLYELAPAARDNLREILHEDMTDKNRATKADVAKWVLDKNLIHTETPKLQMTMIKTDRESKSTTITTAQIDPVRVSKEEMSEFVQIALKTKQDVEKTKQKRLTAKKEAEDDGRPAIPTDL